VGVLSTLSGSSSSFGSAVGSWKDKNLGQEAVNLRAV